MKQQLTDYREATSRDRNEILNAFSSDMSNYVVNGLYPFDLTTNVPLKRRYDGFIADGFDPQLLDKALTKAEKANREDYSNDPDTMRIINRMEPIATELQPAMADAEPPPIDEEAGAEYLAKGEAAKLRWIIEDDVLWMQKRLEQAIAKAPLHYERMQDRLKRQNNQRALSLKEVALIACIHRRNILTNNHQVVDGKHVGDSPGASGEGFTKKGKHKIPNIGRLVKQHASAVFELLAILGFAKLINRNEITVGLCGRYAADPSHFWGFPNV